MRENRPCGSEGGEGQTLPDPYRGRVYSLRYRGGKQVAINPGTPSVDRISVYLSKKELAALRKTAARSGRGMSELVRTAIRTVVLKQQVPGFVGIWNGELKRTSVEHDSVHDEP